MGSFKVAAIALVVAGALALLYGSFSYTKETHRTQIGGLELAVKEKETVNIPAWVGALALVTGGLMLGSRALKH
jgi:TRAP-type C4-dicarboxylate transport system permease small subunit